eukprot:8787023-Pyramimonas_sp.AAC.2
MFRSMLNNIVCNTKRVRHFSAFVVNTSQPVAVTPTVCSYWAPYSPSGVTVVHPSANFSSCHNPHHTDIRAESRGTVYEGSSAPGTLRGLVAAIVLGKRSGGVLSHLGRPDSGQRLDGKEHAFLQKGSGPFRSLVWYLRVVEDGKCYTWVTQ